MSAETYAELQARMTKAFDLVQPASHWKDPICATVTFARLFKEGVTIADIEEAVSHFTATPARVTQFAGHIEVRAAGYRAGPAGDR